MMKIANGANELSANTDQKLKGVAIEWQNVPSCM
jgi:hypothetical protein